MKWYLKTGKDIVEHIYNETDISKFVVTCHKGKVSLVYVVSSEMVDQMKYYKS